MSEHLILSDKYKEFLAYDGADFEVLEGTTASGKTTIGVIKFILTEVMRSNKKQHIIAGQDLGVIQKNIIESEFGIRRVFGNTIEYNLKGRGNLTMPHLTIRQGKKEKYILLLGYDNQSRWKKALGGQYGCVYCDEINTADMAFVRQIMMRCDYAMATLNPDDPDAPIYKEYINRCRPLEKYKYDAPKELLEMLDEEPHEKWVWWYFSFEHNAGISEEKKTKIITSYTPGSAEWLHYIKGVRGRVEGVIFDNFDKKKHCITETRINEILNARKGEKFILFTSGLDTAYSQNSQDTVAMSFLGITNERNIYLLAEEHYNGQDSKEFYSPSEIVEKYIQFLERNRDRYGFARDTFIDSADQATISEFRKYKNTKGSVYNFNNAYKALKIIDRIQIQKGWLATGNMFINENCSYYIKELQTYHWDNKKINEPCDSDDHMINSVQYAWIPYKDKIGKN